MLSWNEDMTRTEKARIPQYYRSVQLLHSYFLEQAKYVFPIIVTPLVVMVDVFLYRVVMHHRILPGMTVRQITFISICILLFLHYFVQIANALRMASQALPTTFLRNRPEQISQLDRRIFRSLQVLKTEFMGIFTVSNVTFIQGLSSVVVDTVIFMILTFRDA